MRLKHELKHFFEFFNAIFSLFSAFLRIKLGLVFCFLIKLFIFYLLIMASFKEALNIESSNQCICERNDSVILCQGCRMFSYGRVRRKCPQHPNVRFFVIEIILFKFINLQTSFLYDMEVCPKCKFSTSMIEVSIPRDMAEKINASLVQTSL